MDGKFIKGRFIEYGSTVEVLTIMGDVFSYSECLECLNDITKEISAFGPHQK